MSHHVTGAGVRLALQVVLCLVLMAGSALRSVADDHHDHGHGHGQKEAVKDHDHPQHEHHLGATTSVTKTEAGDLVVTPLPEPEMTPALKAYRQDEARKMSRQLNWVVTVTHHGGQATIEVSGSGTVEVVSAKKQSRALPLSGRMWLTSDADWASRMEHYEKLRRDDTIILRLREDSEVRINAAGPMAVQVGAGSSRRVVLQGKVNCVLRGAAAALSSSDETSCVELYGFESVRSLSSFAPPKIYTRKCKQVWVEGKTEAYAQECEVVYVEGEARLVAHSCAVVRLKGYADARLKNCEEVSAEDNAIIRSDDHSLLVSMSGKAVRKGYGSDEVPDSTAEKRLHKSGSKR